MNAGFGQGGAGLLQALAQHLFLAASAGQRGGGQFGARAGLAGAHFGAARLLAGLGGEQLAGEQRLAALAFAAGLVEIALRLAQRRQRLRPAGVDQLA
ncbi:hypothetical protein D3C81_1935080 [compost metagenome]